MCLFPFLIWHLKSRRTFCGRFEGQVKTSRSSRQQPWQALTADHLQRRTILSAVRGDYDIRSVFHRRQSRQFVTLSRNHWFCGFLLQTQILELFQLKKFFSSCSQFLFVCCLILKLSLSFRFADNLCTGAQRFAVIFLYLFCTFFSHFPFLVWVWR